MQVRLNETEAPVKSESLHDFYRMFTANRPEISIPSLELVSDIGHFNVFRRSGFCSVNPSPYNRRDYYKISFIIGTGTLYYQERQIEINGKALLFTNPEIPYSWEACSEKQSGFFCLFTENFIRKRNDDVRDLLLLKTRDNPVIFLEDKDLDTFNHLFSQMMREMDAAYSYKYDLQRNYLGLIFHEALKLLPAGPEKQYKNASLRLTSQFLEMLERQFPIDSTDHILGLKTAHDFAARLCIHVNHLNYAVKEATGMTTSEHISRRITNESIALLRHTEWNIAEISYCLGFEYPANFNIFFKRQTGATPRSFRVAK
ncbi:helix-turn-helix domain-containing protein [Hufsiella ginkgonis]|uniref:Helix-turn-helix domain-containing protein n=1 Tax=Hufsiella ginkgonis TaxID=2695274 RepID=A0A7K1XUS9_9SPHI|nr:helix-turn-helix transcriptional regulator [Hufsiella ginkgonis]MXV14557.1 helix-turn-helix domain-containing protein [Hufsiella ginkgonis]